MMRPAPPEGLLSLDELAAFEPAPDLALWARETFIESGAPLQNLDHLHLQCASLGFLWTNARNTRQGRAVVGQCEIGRPNAMGAWARARAELQIRRWFGEIPDFILTFDVFHARECDDASFCALVEHELYHAGQARDAFGAPRFTKEGRPVFAMRGHDVEEFTGVVARYGAAAAGVLPMIDAALGKPKIGPARIAGACGSCLKVAA